MRYISNSEVYTFYERGEQEYYSQYILGIREPANEPMILGKIIHEVLEDKNYNWQEAIKQLSKQPQTTYKRVVEQIIATVPRSHQKELKLYANTQHGFQIYAGIDGVDPEVLTEYKTGASLWTQDRADESQQITHYLLAWWLKYNEELPFRLITISSKTGKFKELRTARTKKQLDEKMEQLMQLKRSLIELGWWDKKLSIDKRITL